MKQNHNNTPVNSLLNRQSKDKEIIKQFIRKQVESATELPFNQLISEYSNFRRYFIALRCVTTTNKAVCEAMQIPIEAGTRYKDKLEKKGVLVASIDKFICPYTKEPGVQLLSTNPDEFAKLQKSRFNQLTLF